MRTSVKYLVAMLAVVAVGGGLLLHSVHDANSPLLETTQSAESATATKRTERPALHPESDEKLAKATNSSTKNEEPPTAPSIQDESQSETDSSVDFNALDANSVVGRPFPVSASVIDSCERFKLQGKELQCKDSYAALANMAQEPRDTVWAPKAEEALRKLIMMEPDKYTIRNIECRTSICVAEYSAVRPQQLFPSHEFQRDSGLTEEIRMFAYETDPSGATLIVTVIPFTRRR